jgi:protein-S-isoprenylcysteine O-methyltransferase Ste14
VIDPVRIVLLAGLVFHKAVWEVMKARGKTVAAPVAVPLLTKLVKLVKLGVLLFLVAQTLFLDVLPIPGPPEGRRAVGVALYLAGLAIAVTGRVQLGRNWADLEDYQVGSKQAVVSHGIYGYIRHPIYTGDLLLLTGLELALNSWLVLGVLLILAVVLRQAAAEEVLLAQRLDGYADYRARTKRFVPFLY